jgi:hypothetical protein
MKLQLEVPDELLQVAPPPEFISQRNCGHLGLEPGDFLRLLPDAEAAGVQVSRQGKLRLVRRDAFARWLSRPAPVSETSAANDSDPDAQLHAELDGLTKCAPVQPRKKGR